MPYQQPPSQRPCLLPAWLACTFLPTHGLTTDRQGRPTARSRKARVFPAGQPSPPGAPLILLVGLGSCKGSALLARAIRPAMRIVAGSAHHQPGEESQQPGHDRAGPFPQVPEPSCLLAPPPPLSFMSQTAHIWDGNSVLAKHKK